MVMPYEDARGASARGTSKFCLPGFLGHPEHSTVQYVDALEKRSDAVPRPSKSSIPPAKAEGTRKLIAVTVA